MTPGDDPKTTLRRELLRSRATVLPVERARLSGLVCGVVLGLRSYRRARHVVAYEPLGAEVDPGGVVADALSSRKLVYYPSLVGERLEFAADEAAGGDVLAPGAAGAVILVPGVGFDGRGVRLGRGGGHYDRALAEHPAAVRIGIAYEVQLVPALPRDAWDVAMDIIVTEARVLDVASSERRRVLEETAP